MSAARNPLDTVRTESFEIEIPKRWKVLEQAANTLSLLGEGGEEIQISVVGMAGAGTSEARGKLLETLRQRALRVVYDAAREAGQKVIRQEERRQLQNGMSVDVAEYASEKSVLAQYLGTSATALLLLTISKPPALGPSDVDATRFLERVRCLT